MTLHPHTRHEPLIKSFDQRAQLYMPGQNWTGDKAVASLRESLSKALGISDGNAFGNTTGLQLENLDATLTEVLTNERFMVMFNALAKIPSKNALFEYTRKDGYGSFRGTAGFREGGAPSGANAAYTRHTANVRYMGEKGGVTHQLSVAGDMGGTQLDPVAEENRNTTIRLMAKIERAIARGRSDILDSNGAAVNYDGIIPWMHANASTHVVNMKGAPITLDRLDTMAYSLFQEGKMLDFSKVHGFLTGHIMQDIGASLRSLERSILTADPKTAGLVPGAPVPGYMTQFGYLPFAASQFLDEVEGDQPLLVNGDSNAPPAPAAPTGVAASDTASTMPAGTYYYYTSAYNPNGESTATRSAAGIAVNAGEGVTLTITRVAGAIGYRVYRGTTADNTQVYWIGTVTQTGNGNATFVDRNQKVPGTGTAIFMSIDPADVAIAQLAPLVKWPLAIVNTTVEFLLLLYHVLVIKAPERVWVFENVGKAS